MTDPKHKCITIDVHTHAVGEAAMSFSDAQEFVGGYLEPVRLDAWHVLLVDEDGLLKRLARAFELHGVGRFVGNAVIVGQTGSEFTDHQLRLPAMRALVAFTEGQYGLQH